MHQVFATERSLAYHNRKPCDVDDGSDTFLCTRCGTVFDTERGVNAHRERGGCRAAPPRGAPAAVTPAVGGAGARARAGAGAGAGAGAAGGGAGAARTPAELEAARASAKKPPMRCERCGREFLGQRALHTHQRFCAGDDSAGAPAGKPAGQRAHVSHSSRDALSGQSDVESLEEVGGGAVGDMDEDVSGPAASDAEPDGAARGRRGGSPLPSRAAVANTLALVGSLVRSIALAQWARALPVPLSGAWGAPPAAGRVHGPYETELAASD